MSVRHSVGGYTLSEVLISIAIMSILFAVVGFTYSLGKNYDTLTFENQRFASALRGVRNRDFNGVVYPTRVCSNNLSLICESDGECTGGTCTRYADIYPSLGYGLHIETNYKVCANDDTKSCFIDSDCGGSTCSNSSGKSNYTLFANRSDAAGSLFDGGKSGREYIEEIKVPKDFGFVLPSGATQADILFKGGVVSIYTDASGWTALTPAPSTYVIELQYKPGCTSQVKNMKGRITLTTVTRGFFEELVSCL